MAAPGKKLAPTLPAKPATAHVRRYPRFALDARMHVRMFQDGEFKNCWGHSTEIGQDGIIRKRRLHTLKMTNLYIYTERSL